MASGKKLCRRCIKQLRQPFITIRKGKAIMRLLLAIFLPFICFFTIGRPIAGIICLLLQITLIGWLPAALWAVYALSQFKTDQKIKKSMLANQSKSAS